MSKITIDINGKKKEFETGITKKNMDELMEETPNRLYGIYIDEEIITCTKFGFPQNTWTQFHENFNSENFEIEKFKNINNISLSQKNIIEQLAQGDETTTSTNQPDDMSESDYSEIMKYIINPGNWQSLGNTLLKRSELTKEMYEYMSMDVDLCVELLNLPDSHLINKNRDDIYFMITTTYLRSQRQNVIQIMADICSRREDGDKIIIVSPHVNRRRPPELNFIEEVIINDELESEEEIRKEDKRRGEKIKEFAILAYNNYFFYNDDHGGTYSEEAQQVTIKIDTSQTKSEFLKAIEEHNKQNKKVEQGHVGLYQTNIENSKLGPGEKDTITAVLDENLLEIIEYLKKDARLYKTVENFSLYKPDFEELTGTQLDEFIYTEKDKNKEEIKELQKFKEESIKKDKTVEVEFEDMNELVKVIDEAKKICGDKEKDCFKFEIKEKEKFSEQESQEPKVVVIYFNKDISDDKIKSIVKDIKKNTNTNVKGSKLFLIILIIFLVLATAGGIYLYVKNK
jgi:hypothetical protein